MDKLKIKSFHQHNGDIIKPRKTKIPPIIFLDINTSIVYSFNSVDLYFYQKESKNAKKWAFGRCLGD